MTVMYSFCFWYSVRLGTIIVAFTCMAQCLVALIACGYGMSDVERTSSNIDYWLQTSDLKMTKFFFEAMRNDPKPFLTTIISIISVYFSSCVLLIYAAFQCNINLMYPFMIMDFIRLLILSFALVIILILVKGNTLDLGVIIGCSILGVFTLLYLWYQWFCTVSLWQIIREIERLDQIVKAKPNINTISEELTKRENFFNAPYYLPSVSL